MIEEQSSNKLYEKQVLENEDPLDELQQQETIPGNVITNDDLQL